MLRPVKHVSIILFAIVVIANYPCNARQKVSVTFDEEDAMMAFAAGDIKEALGELKVSACPIGGTFFDD